MSTPISDIPDDVDSEELFSNLQVTNETTKHKIGKFDSCKQYVLLFFAVLLGLQIPIDNFRVSIPHKAFAFGDTPVQAFVIVLTVILLKLLVTQVG